MKSRVQVYTLLVILALTAALAAGCGPQVKAEHGLNMLPASQLHPVVQMADERTQEAYRFAAANPEILEHIPCTCGCVQIGHKNNYDCYFADVTESGAVEFDMHATGCQVCVDISHDVMAMVREGKDAATMRAAIDRDYLKFGPSTMPENHS
jgi:hypothetical protein